MDKSAPVSTAQLGQITYNKKQTPRHPTSKRISSNPLAPTTQANGVEKPEAYISVANLRKQAMIKAATKVAAEVKFERACQTGKVCDRKMESRWKWRLGANGAVVGVEKKEMGEDGRVLRG
jgi:hypothetical protein